MRSETRRATARPFQLLPLVFAAASAAPAAPQSGPTLQVLEDCGAHGYRPEAPVIQASDGRIYGTCTHGGLYGNGTVFVMDLDGSNAAVVHDFDVTEGFAPMGLIQGGDGVLYGTTLNGGSNDEGTVFRVNPDGTGFSVLVSFDRSTIGAYPYGTLVEGSDGLLYGTTNFGGVNDLGTVFQMATDGSFFNVILYFDGANSGSQPEAGLIQGTDGAFYGTTTHGGSHGLGTVFRLALTSIGRFKIWVPTLLVQFDGTSGSAPYTALLQASDGALYGTTVAGGASGLGTIFKVGTDGTGFAILKDLDATTGDLPVDAGPIIERSDGTLCGVTLQGGAHSYGTAYSIGKDGSGFVDLFDFDYSGPSAAYAKGLIEASDGNLYGTCMDGDPAGPQNLGVVFRLVDHAASWTNYGSGVPGLYGVPTFTAGGDPVLGKHLSLTVFNCRGVTTSATLFIGLSRASLPLKGGTLLVGSILLLDTFALPPPTLSFDGDLPYDPALAGFVLDLQVLEADPAAVKGLAFTPGLELVLGF